MGAAGLERSDVKHCDIVAGAVAGGHCAAICAALQLGPAVGALDHDSQDLDADLRVAVIDRFDTGVLNG